MQYITVEDYLPINNYKVPVTVSTLNYEGSIFEKLSIYIAERLADAPGGPQKLNKNFSCNSSYLAVIIRLLFNLPDAR